MNSPVRGILPRTRILLCAVLPRAHRFSCARYFPAHTNSPVRGTLPRTRILLCAALPRAHRFSRARHSPAHRDSPLRGHRSRSLLLMITLFHDTRVLSMSSHLQTIGWIGTLVSWAPKITARSFVARDQYDNMLLAVTLDPLIKPTRFGIGREVRSPISHMSSHVLADHLTLFLYRSFASFLTI